MVNFLPCTKSVPRSRTHPAATLYCNSHLLVHHWPKSRRHLVLYTSKSLLSRKHVKLTKVFVIVVENFEKLRCSRRSTTTTTSSISSTTGKLEITYTFRQNIARKVAWIPFFLRLDVREGSTIFVSGRSCLRYHR